MKKEHSNSHNEIYIEEVKEEMEVAGTWSSLGTFATAGSCTSSASSASSMG